MKRLLLITGDLATGKSTFSTILSKRYGIAVFQKDTIKEILGDRIGFRSREENKKLSHATIDIMCHIFKRIASTGNDLILEANFHEDELAKLHSIAGENGYAVLTLVLRADIEIIYQRYLHRMREENRHPVHLATTFDVKDDFSRYVEECRKEHVIGQCLEIDASDFSYQEDSLISEKIDRFITKA